MVKRRSTALRRMSYTPDYYRLATMRDGTTLFIFHSICTGTADGHCQAIDVFQNDKPTAVLHRQYASVLGINLQINGFAVKSVQYARGDPLCCPSLPPRVDIYRWNGSQLRPSRSVSEGSAK
jgi:hypothetical protein